MKKAIFTVCALFLVAAPAACLPVGRAYAIDAATQQHVQELQAQINALEAQAQQYRDAIGVQQDKAATLQRDISILQSQINQLQVELNATGKKIDLTGTQISQTEDHITQTENAIEQKRNTIGRMVFFVDQYDQQSIIESLIKYNDLSSFLAQFHDLAMVQQQMLGIIDDLQASKADLESSKADLEGKQQQLQQLHDQTAQQQQQLSSVKGEKNKVLKDTKGQEALYQKQLTDVEKKKSAFFGEMEKLESQIIAGGLFIVHITAATTPKKGKLYQLPEEHPRLTQGYGCTTYARCGHANGPYGGAPHNGVDYASGYGAPIKAIGDGTIVAHGTNDGWGNWVAIRHPNDLVSLYAHMSSFVMLPVSTPVSAGQVIGYEGNTGKVTGAHVHLSIYKDFFTYVNPVNGQLYFNYFEGSLNPLNYL